MALRHTPSQTVGPYFSMRLSGEGHDVLVRETAKDAIRIVGTVYDADRDPIDDALVEIWQADARGRYATPASARASGFSGFGRAEVDPKTRQYSFVTVKPGRVPAPDGTEQAPHVSVIVQGRGMLRPLFTRIYFDDEAAANAEDFVLSHVPRELRHLLVAACVPGAPVPTYHFDVRLQGEDETVFFEFHR